MSLFLLPSRIWHPPKSRQDPKSSLSSLSRSLSHLHRGQYFVRANICPHPRPRLLCGDVLCSLHIIYIKKVHHNIYEFIYIYSILRFLSKPEEDGSCNTRFSCFLEIGTILDSSLEDGVLLLLLTRRPARGTCPPNPR